MGRLLTVHEVADYLRTTPNTIYRWCRSSRINAIKIGKEWRIDEDALNSFLTGSQNNVLASPAPFWNQIESSEHLMALTSSKEEVFKLEASFFEQALKRGYRVYKGCWWQEEGEVRKKLFENGIDTVSLEREGRFAISDLKKLYQKQGTNGPVEAWQSEIEKTRSLGFSTLWASGSPHLLSCGDDCAEILSFEDKLNHALKEMPVVGICPYYLDDFNLHNFDHLLTLMRYHSGTVLFSRGQSTLLRSVS